MDEKLSPIEEWKKILKKEYFNDVMWRVAHYPEEKRVLMFNYIILKEIREYRDGLVKKN